MPRPRFITRIDWEMLKEQKAHFVSVIYSGELKSDQKEALEGILHLLDAIQDHAVDSMGISEEEVFGKYHQQAVNKK